jgi:hypothetical protein
MFSISAWTERCEGVQTEAYDPLEELLFSDSCFMTAGKALAAQLTQPQSQPQLPAVPAFLTKQTSIRPSLVLDCELFP